MPPAEAKAFRFAVSQIKDGFLFEQFSQSFLSAVLGYAFEPAGGLKDRGIDGLEHVFSKKGVERQIYQSSVEETPESKVEKTLTKLAENSIPHDGLVYVTNQIVPNKDVLIDQLYEKFRTPVRIWDIGWFATNANHSTATQNAYHEFVTNNLHEFNQPGKSYIVSELISDPRLYVFLRQQWDANKSTNDIAEILADTLILYALEGTDPDKGEFKTAERIRTTISSLIKFEPSLILSLIDQRLRYLCRKPKASRLVHYHPKLDAYCLSHAARLQIQQRNLADRALHGEFRASVETKLKGYLKDAAVAIKDCVGLIEAALHRIYYQQGLEFSNFVLKGDSQGAIEKNLPDILGIVVDESAVVLKNKERVKSALLMTIRDVVYNGSDGQKEFLRRLCSTYMMLFVLQCDPKLTTYFSTIADQLNVYVCTSIIIPALSEYYLDAVNRRHWNLLKGARSAGVTLLINETILDELVSHFRRFVNIYSADYSDVEELYIGDENQALYIDEIMIRAYFYARTRGHVETFDQFLETFLSPDLRHAHDDLRIWLGEEFGIEFRPNTSLACKINDDDEKRLIAELKEVKGSVDKARNDARLILTVNAIRESANEQGSEQTNPIFGYKTWWLSKDVTTQKALVKVFKDKYKVSCYMRPDFLYNYIALAPKKPAVDAAYRELFPTLIGVNISFHMPHEVIDSVNRLVSEHKSKNVGRLKALLHELGENLKADSALRGKVPLTHYLDERVKELAAFPPRPAS